MKCIRFYGAHLMVVLCSILVGAATATASVNVTNFGAVANDAKDDTAAFLAAFQDSAARSDGHIVIPQGKYRLQATGNPKNAGVLFAFDRREHLTIEGQGAELVFTGNATIFHFWQCTNVTVKGLVIDWERPPFSEGTVIASEPRFFDVQIATNYPVKGGEPVGAFMSYDPITRLPAGKDCDVYDAVEKTELVRDQVLRVRLKRDVPVSVGTLLVLRHQVYGYNAFVFARCANVTATDIDIYTVPGMGLVGGHSRDLTLKDFNVLIRPQSGRLMSATADATHFGGCKGTVTIENCLFEGMGDDGANIKSGLYLIVRKKLDDHTVLGQHNLKMVDLPDPGDTMAMLHVDTLLPFASGLVTASSIEPGAGNLHRVRFDQPLPTELREGDVLGNTSRVPALRMRHCTVARNRARGVLCQTWDAIIEDCTFRHCTSAGVLVLTEVCHFHESIGTRNVTVRNNLFENCNRGAAPADAPLCALAWLKDFAYPPKPGVHENVTFENNRIIGAANCGIFAAGVKGLKIRQNTITAAPNTPIPADWIRILNCSNVVRE